MDHIDCAFPQGLKPVSMLNYLRHDLSHALSKQRLNSIGFQESGVRKAHLG
jgi:hypothetical protein